MNKICFAPHPDDELIGIFSLLQNKEISDVYFFFDCDETRKKEAEASAKEFGFTSHFVSINDSIEIGKDTIIYVPSAHDIHFQHKAVNRYAKVNYNPSQLRYYSIDMNRKPKPLNIKNRARKSLLCNTLYPSQRRLFTSSEKYHLFEDIHNDDSTKMIWVTFQKKGFHRYIQAGTDKSLEDVSYLAERHRHLFKFNVAIEVNHADRDIEFHQFLNWLESLYDESVIDVDYKSVEMISDDLMIQIMKKYKDRKLEISVSEDGECGTTCTYQI